MNTIRAALTAAAAAAVTVLAVGCSPDTETATAEPVASALAGLPAAASAAKEKIDLGAFAAAYRQAYPALAEGRTDQAIGDDAENTCFDVLAAQEPGVVTNHVIARFTGQDGTAPTAAQADAIIELVKANGCTA